MSKWRPEGFDVEEIFEKYADNVEDPTRDITDYGLINAGADALLEALRKNAVSKYWYTNQIGGTWVFIPKD